MTMMPLSDKQLAFAAHGDSALAIAFGAVRSGKTFAGAFGFLVHTQKEQPDKLHLITGRNKAVLQRELVRSLEDFADYFDLRTDYKSASGDLTIGGVDYYVSAGYDAKSEGRIRGLSIGSVLFDEATLCPEEYFEQTVARMTFENSKMWATCNPDSTNHWIKRQWIDKGKFGGGVHNLSFDDNPSLTNTVKQRNSELFSGVFHARMVEGQWTDSTGLIYPEFHTAPHYKPEDVSHTDIGIDYGTASVTTFVAIDYLRGTNKGVVAGVWYWNAVDEGRQLTDEDVVRELRRFCDKMRVRRGCIFCDPSAASLILSIRRANPGIPAYVRESDNDVLSGLRVCGAAFANQRLTLAVDETNTPLIDELTAYRWDENKDDEPIKHDDHAVDALRYAYYTRNKYDYATEKGVPIPRGW